MSDRLLNRLKGQPPRPRELSERAFDERRVDACLRALGVVGMTLLAGLALLLALALATPHGLRGVHLAESPPAAAGSRLPDAS